MSDQDPLFDFESADEAYMLSVRPSPWLLSLPEDQQIKKLRKHIRLMESKKNSAADLVEAARINQIIAAANRHLRTIESP